MNQSEMEYRKQNPRKEIIKAVENSDLAWCLNKTAEIHGHYCPGSALGVMSTVYGLKQLGNGIMISDGMENLMAIVECNACFADGVQVVSGCTLGNNALVYRDFGRLAVTFAIRGKEEGIRVCVRSDFQSCINKLVPEFYPLMEKVIKNRQGTAEDETAFKNMGYKTAFAILSVSYEEILVIESVHPSLPAYAPITDSVICPGCGEMIMASKAVDTGDKKDYCLKCGGNNYYQVDGRGISIINNNGAN